MRGGRWMNFIGRQNELSKLKEEYNRDGSFVVIYGRRRVEKTTLIKEFLKNKLVFYFLATEEMELGSEYCEIHMISTSEPFFCDS